MRRTLLVFLACALFLIGGASPQNGVAQTGEFGLDKWKEEAYAIGFTFVLIKGAYLYDIDPAECRLRVLSALFGEDEIPAGTAQKKKYPNCSFDEFSAYFPPDDAKKLEMTLNGRLGGIGARVSQTDTGLMVQEVLPDGPADAAGIREGDVLIEARVSHAGARQPLKTSDDKRFLRGIPGTRVFVVFVRDGITMETWITRAMVSFPSVYAHRLVSEAGTVGYFAVTTFGDRTDEEFEDALSAFLLEVHDTPPNIIIDLRYNRGGSLETALELLYDFAQEYDDSLLTRRFRTGPLMISTAEFPWGKVLNRETGDFESIGEFYDRDGNPKAHGLFRDARIAILVNKRSASASEVFSGTMQDWGHTRARPIFVVGATTYGKGVGQVVFPLGKDGKLGELHLTSFEFFVGNSQTKVHKVGITPDYFVADGVPEKEFRPWRVPYADADPQLAKAIEVLRHATLPPPREGSFIKQDGDKLQ